MAKHGVNIHLYSIHGLIRGEKVELGRDADTGGQVKYVLELANALGQHPDVRHVSLFTRLIQDKTVSPDYARPIEVLSENVRIVRIQCGGTKYIRKELLWRHLDEFVDKTLKFIKDHDDLPDVVHGHYADAGYVAMELSTLLGVPFIFTGHSLGRVKQSDLREQGLSEDEMIQRYHIDHRIKVEDEVLTRADLVIASTSHETCEQYGHYEASQFARFAVIPPGIDIGWFYPFFDDPLIENGEREEVKAAQFYTGKELERFLSSPDKPLILALSRPDHRKNITGLIEAYGMDKELQAIANLAVFAGIRKDIATMNDNEREVLTELLLLMDKFDLYGKLAIPKRHDVKYEVPELYRLTARKQGVFVNPAFKENFGLTLIEAASSGLPIVATDSGGPHDIVKNCQNGLTLDVNDPQALTAAIKNVLTDQEQWKRFSQNGIKGVREHYTWEAHTQKYLTQIRQVLQDTRPNKTIFAASTTIGKKFTQVKHFFLTDIDDTLIGDDDALNQWIGWFEVHRDRVGFGVVTGRPIESARAVLLEHQVPFPDIMVTSVGTEMYYGKDLLADKGWQAHISQHWEPKQIQSVLADFSFLSLQEDEAQRPWKISYCLEPAPEHLTAIHRALTEQRLRYTLIYSRDIYLDILPYHASKGKAIRYLSNKWNIPLRNIVVAGDSGNDEDILRGEMLGIVVGNHSAELEELRGLRHIYFSPENYAAGILDGFTHYGFPGKS